MSDQIEALSVGERLLLSRRRRGETQQREAWRLGVTRQVYNLAERDHVAPSWEVPEIAIDSLTGGERCLLYRRRLGLTQGDLARQRGMSRFWINRQERDKTDPSDLVCYWEC